MSTPAIDCTNEYIALETAQQLHKSSTKNPRLWVSCRLMSDVTRLLDAIGKGEPDAAALLPEGKAAVGPGTQEADSSTLSG